MSYHYHLFDTFKINFIIRFSRYGLTDFVLSAIQTQNAFELESLVKPVLYKTSFDDYIYM